MWAKNFNFGAKTGSRSLRSINVMISLIWSYDSSLENLGNHKNSIIKRPEFSDGIIHTILYLMELVSLGKWVTSKLWFPPTHTLLCVMENALFKWLWSPTKFFVECFCFYLMFFGPDHAHNTSFVLHSCYKSMNRGFHQYFQQVGVWCSQASKTFWTKILH